MKNFSSSRGGALSGCRGTGLLTLLIGSLLLAAAFIRLDSYAYWLEHKSRYFFNQPSTPLTLTVDAYYYLDIAKQLRTGEFTPHDDRRQVPRGYTRSSTPPLISVLLAAIADLTGLGLEVVAVVLPAFWGALLGIPAFLLAERIFRLPGDTPPASPLSSSQVAGLVAAAVTLVSPKLVVRTSLGWFDTDGLNLFFALWAAYFALQFLCSIDRKQRLLWFLAAAINQLLFIWNWDQSPVAALALGLAPLLTVLLLDAVRSPWNVAPLLIPGTLFLAALVWWKGLAIVHPQHILAALGGYLDYFTNTVAATSAFPDPGRYVSEQRGLNLGEIAANSAGHLWVWLAALPGLLLSAWLRPRQLLPLIPLLLVALLSFEANRFQLFVAPLVGVGIGAQAHFLWRLSAPSWARIMGTLLLLAACTYPAILKCAEYNRLQPRRTPILFEAMLSIAQKTPPEAVIWSSWGHGHALVHYSNRGTLADGIWHPASVSYVINYPLTISDFRLAANWMQFYTSHGMPGLEQANQWFGDSPQAWSQGMPALQSLLRQGPGGARELLTELPLSEREARLRYLFPPDARPLVLFLDHLLADTDWYAAGAWDFDSRTRPARGIYLPLLAVKNTGDTNYSANSRLGTVQINGNTGDILLGNIPMTLQRLNIDRGTQTEFLTFGRDRQLVARLNIQAGTGIAGAPDEVDSLFSSLFYGLKGGPGYFTPLDLQPPYYGLWWVHGDSYQPPISGTDPASRLLPLFQ